MSKTPEELAEGFVNQEDTGSDTFAHGLRNGFLAGYQAAQEHAHAALEEAEAEIDRLQTKLSDAGILTTEHLIDVSKMVSSSETLNNWISVKDRLPGECAGLLIVYHASLKEIGTSYYDEDMWCSSPWPMTSEGVTHWMPLPAAPKEEA